MRVTQEDRDAAATLIEGRAWLISSSQPDWCAIDQKMFRQGAKDDNPFVQAFARHRQAAEKAQQERDAGIAEGKYAAIGWNGHYRSAGHSIATAIRSQGHE